MTLIGMELVQISNKGERKVIGENPSKAPFQDRDEGKQVVFMPRSAHTSPHHSFKPIPNP